MWRWRQTRVEDVFNQPSCPRGGGRSLTSLGHKGCFGRIFQMAAASAFGQGGSCGFRSQMAAR